MRVRYDVFESRAEPLQRALNISQALPRLFIRVVNPDDLAVFARSPWCPVT